MTVSHKLDRYYRLSADSETGIVIHCHTGKDRTGIIIALILATIGLSDEDIATDYALSNQNI